MSMEGPPSFPPKKVAPKAPEAAPKVPESIPSRDHVLAEIGKHCENPHAKVNREKSDEKGPYFIEVQDKDKNGDTVIYEYKRGGSFPNSNEALATVINVVYFDGEMPVGGESLATYNPETQKWE